MSRFCYQCSIEKCLQSKVIQGVGTCGSPYLGGTIHGVGSERFVKWLITSVMFLIFLNVKCC